MSRLLRALAAAFLSLSLVACATGRQPAAQPSQSQNTKLDKALEAKLAQLPADQTVRLVATLEPGVATDQLRDELTRLGGRVVERFTLIEAAVVELPARNVLALAALPHVKGLELDDTGVPPPSPR